MSTPSIRAALERWRNLAETDLLCPENPAETDWAAVVVAIAATRAALALPANYIDPEHQGNALELLQIFYEACSAEGGTADEIYLRGLRAVLAARPAAPPAPEVGEVGEVGKGPILQWTENMPPSEDCRYDHCTAETLFGRFLITWKSWKQFDSPTVDETPWGDWYEAFNSVDEAKAACQKEMDERLARWSRPAAPPAPEVGEQPVSQPYKLPEPLPRAGEVSHG